MAVFVIFDLEFFGCRGSTPACGPQFVKYGGNTTCIAIYSDESLFIIDGGTGLAPLQAALFNTGRYTRANVFLTHIHWDHIQGIPFFAPFFMPGCSFAIHGERRNEMSLRQQLNLLMSAPVFPVTLEAFNAQIDWRDISCGDVLETEGVRVTCFRLRHPDICTGFRFEAAGKSICVVGDYEHGDDEPVEFARDADVLIYDAQYTDAEYSAKVGWGHSTWRQGCELAKKCGAKRLYLTHHDPWHTDSDLDAMEQEAREAFPHAAFAAEGKRITV